MDSLFTYMYPKNPKMDSANKIKTFRNDESMPALTFPGKRSWSTVANNSRMPRPSDISVQLEETNEKHSRKSQERTSQYPYLSGKKKGSISIPTILFDWVQVSCYGIILISDDQELYCI